MFNKKLIFSTIILVSAGIKSPVIAKPLLRPEISDLIGNPYLSPNGKGPLGLARKSARDMLDYVTSTGNAIRFRERELGLKEDSVLFITEKNGAAFVSPASKDLLNLNIVTAKISDNGKFAHANLVVPPSLTRPATIKLTESSELPTSPGLPGQSVSITRTFPIIEGFGTTTNLDLAVKEIDGKIQTVTTRFESFLGPFENLQDNFQTKSLGSLRRDGTTIDISTGTQKEGGLQFYSRSFILPSSIEGQIADFSLTPDASKLSVTTSKGQKFEFERQKNSGDYKIAAEGQVKVRETVFNEKPAIQRKTYNRTNSRGLRAS